MFIFILLVIGLIIYLVVSTRENSTPQYKQTYSYKALNNEAKLRTDLTLALEELVKSSLKISKERNYSADRVNLTLIFDINAFRIDLQDNMYSMASTYKISVFIVQNIIDSVCDNTIHRYIPEI